MKFRQWLKLHEVGTSTNAIAVYARPLFSEPFTRDYPELKKKKKRKFLEEKK